MYQNESVLKKDGAIDCGPNRGRSGGASWGWAEKGKKKKETGKEAAIAENRDYKNAKLKVSA